MIHTSGFGAVTVPFATDCSTTFASHDWFTSTECWSPVTKQYKWNTTILNQPMYFFQSKHISK